MLKQCAIWSVSLILSAGVVRAEPPPRSSGPFRGRPAASAAPAPSAADGRRPIFPGLRGPDELAERLRGRTKAPDGPRTKGRLARSRERAYEQTLRKPDATPEEIRQKLAELKEHSADLQRERRRSLHQRWGASAQKPEVKAELERHGRTLARLRRMQFLAATERQGEARAKLLERLGRLVNLERGRHERAMEALVGDERRAVRGHLPSSAPRAASSGPRLRALPVPRKPVDGGSP